MVGSHLKTRMTLLPPTITLDEATAQGMHPLAGFYHLAHERWMLDNLLADMRRGRIPVALVSFGPELVEVWRRPWNAKAPNGTNGAVHHYRTGESPLVVRKGRR